jgi:hypothetical protein
MGTNGGSNEQLVSHRILFGRHEARGGGANRRERKPRARLHFDQLRTHLEAKCGAVCLLEILGVISRWALPCRRGKYGRRLSACPHSYFHKWRRHVGAIEPGR